MIPIERNEDRTTRPRSRGGEKGGDISRLFRSHVTRPHAAAAALALVSLALPGPRYAAAAENEEIVELRRALREVQAQNRELARRLGTLESTRAPPAAPRSKPASTQEQSASDKPRTPAPTAADPSSKDVSSKDKDASSKDPSRA